MSEMLNGQASGLLKGINAFEGYIDKIHSDYKSEQFSDWPTIVLSTTLQTTSCSLFKLLPRSERSNEAVDIRSIATLVRNIVDTHDVLRMMVNVDSKEQFLFNRNLLSHYISSRMHAVQDQISPEDVQQHLKTIKSKKWQEITNSSLFKPHMRRLKKGEQIFYESRKERVQAVLGEQTDFVLGILADISTYVHSVSPPMWFSHIDNLYSDNTKNRDLCAVWVRLACFYLAQSFEYFFAATQYEKSPEITTFIEHHQTAFS